MVYYLKAPVAELAYALVLGTSPARGRGSSPLGSTLQSAQCKQKTALLAVFDYDSWIAAFFVFSREILGMLMVSMPLSIWASAALVSTFSGRTILRENGPQ